jgi:hypothetical protein
MDVPPLSDDESLVRAFFCPEQHDGQVFLATAVSLDDLKDRGFSVDRPTLTPLSVLTHRVDNQRAKNPEKREFPKYSQLYYSKLKEDRNAEGQHFFEIQPSPVLESWTCPAILDTRRSTVLTKAWVLGAFARSGQPSLST